MCARKKSVGCEMGGNWMVGAKLNCGGLTTPPLASVNSLWTELAELENWLAIEFMIWMEIADELISLWCAGCFGSSDKK